MRRFIAVFVVGVIILTHSLLALCGTEDLKTLIQSGDINAIRELLRGSDCRERLNQSDEVGTTPLHVAAYYGKLEIVKLFLAMGSNVNAERMDKITPLIFSIWKLKDCMVNCKDQEEIISYLIRAGARLDVLTTLQNISPLFLAVDINSYRVTKLLIDSGASINLMNQSDPPIVRAVFRGNYDIVNLLLSKDKGTNVSTFQGEGPLHRACYQNDLKMVKLLIDKGANVNSKDFKGNTPLSLAIESGGVEIVRLLLDSGASRSMLPYMELVSRSKLRQEDRLFLYSLLSPQSGIFRDGLSSIPGI